MTCFVRMQERQMRAGYVEALFFLGTGVKTMEASQMLRRSRFSASTTPCSIN